MAHCGDTDYAVGEYGLRASPEYWGTLLRTKEHRNLRLNLAHFGGIWSFGNTTAPDAKAAQSWPKMIVSAWNELPDYFNNLFADTAYASNLLVNGSSSISDLAELKAANKFIKQRLNESGLLPKRIMYGSDWQMVGRENLAAQYSSLVDDDISALLPSENHDDFRWRNAAMFLGLRKQDNTYKRLAIFLGQKSGLLDYFDPS
jgi:predicted TIM-barrel fold metal-dependent hydrolase